ncbi:MAG TPA: hypothetical protein VGL32_09625, partial [Acidimicrobiales bacterium]
VDDRVDIRGEAHGARRRPLRHHAQRLSRPAGRAGRQHALPDPEVPTSGAQAGRAGGERAARAAQVNTFGGGVNEVQREIVASVGLGMARSPR